MKKIIAVVMAIAMLFALTLSASAEAIELNWADVEASVTEAGLEGDFYSLNSWPVQLWIPNVMVTKEVSDEDLANGTLCVFATEDGSAFVVVTYVANEEGLTMEQVMTSVEGAGATGMQRITLNGLDAIGYDLEESDASCVSLLTSDNYIITFSAYPMSDEGFQSMSAIIFSSIQSA